MRAKDGKLDATGIYRFQCLKQSSVFLCKESPERLLELVIVESICEQYTRIYQFNIAAPVTF